MCRKFFIIFAGKNSFQMGIILAKILSYILIFLRKKGYNREVEKFREIIYKIL